MDKSDKNLLYKINDNSADPDDKPLYVINSDEEVEESASREVRPEAPEDEDPDQEEDDKKGRGNKSAFLIMIRILVSPVEGWKELRRQNWTQDILGGKLFYPLLALATVVKFAIEMFFDGMDVTVSLKSAIVVFITYFFGYFLVQLIGGIVLPKESAAELKKDQGKTFLMMNISTLVLFFIIYESLPMLQTITFFLPIWTIYIICRGLRFFKIPEDKEVSTTVLTCLLVIGIPIACSWLFGSIL